MIQRAAAVSSRRAETAAIAVTAVEAEEAAAETAAAAEEEAAAEAIPVWGLTKMVWLSNGILPEKPWNGSA